jgi:hypothetical protein
MALLLLLAAQEALGLTKEMLEMLAVAVALRYMFKSILLGTTHQALLPVAAVAVAAEVIMGLKRMLTAVTAVAGVEDLMVALEAQGALLSLLTEVRGLRVLTPLLVLVVAALSPAVMAAVLEVRAQQEEPRLLLAVQAALLALLY